MKLLLENWRKYLTEGPVEKYRIPGSDKYSGNWNDIDVAYKDSDLNFEEPTEDFVLILDKLAELLNLSEPIITSGLRLPKRQVGPMVYLWDKNGGREDLAKHLKGESNRGSKYIIDLYANCASCNKTAGAIATVLVGMWEEGANPLENPRAIPSEVFDASADYIGAQGGISAHQHGEAVDYGIVSNSDKEINQMLEYIKGNDLVNMEVIDERGIAAAHWHVSVYGVNNNGKEFLETPNEQIHISRSPE